MKRPQPKFNVGDKVRFTWLANDQTPHEIWRREWREFEGIWSYQIRGDKWYNENGMVLFSRYLDMAQHDVPKTE